MFGRKHNNEIRERWFAKIVAMKMVWIERDFAKKHYSDHTTKSFYKGLEDFIVEGPVIAIAVEGIHAVETAKENS